MMKYLISIAYETIAGKEEVYQTVMQGDTPLAVMDDAERHVRENNKGCRILYRYANIK